MAQYPEFVLYSYLVLKKTQTVAKSFAVLGANRCLLKSRSKKTNWKQGETPLFIWLSLSVNNGSGLYKLYSNSLWGSNRQAWRQQLESWLCEQESTFSSIAQMKQQHHWIFPETLTLRKKCPYSEFFWSVFSRIWTEYGEILRISPYAVRMWGNMDLKNSEYGH